MPTTLLTRMHPILRWFNHTIPAPLLKEVQQDAPEIGRREEAPGADLRRLCSRLRAQPIGTTPLGIFMSLAYFAIGFSPITALAIAIIGLLPLSTAALLMVLPSFVLGISLALLFPSYGKLALKGLVIGLIAVFLYDCMRVPFILTGIWGDFIPKIGMWLLGTSHPDWVVGYVWRYLGDGGCIGMAFTVAYCVLKPRLGSRVAALGFGIAIWLCLLGTLVLAPHGEEMLFKLTPTTLSLSLLGHLIHGAVIGMLLPAVCRAEMAHTQLWQKKTIPLPQSAGEEEPFDEEQTIKLPRLVWEKKTAPQ